MSRVAIIGGGAAGMMAGIAAGICGHEVHIYEKNEKLGKKIYITGKGRCNLTNASDMETILKNVVTNPKFMYSALYTLSNDMVIDMFNNEMGVETKTERGNRVFPVSDKASDVTGGLTRRLHELGVNIHLGCDIKDILCEEIEGGSKKTVSGIIFKDGTVEKADSVIVATGGFSYRSTGSDGAGYEFAKKTGHKVTEILPALVPLNTKEKYAKELQGLSLKNIKATFCCKDKEIYSEFGEMLFTHFGVSGPVILSGSSYITKKLNNGEDISLKIDLKPALSADELDDRILRDFKEVINKDFANSLGKLLPAKMIPVVIALSEINPHKKVNEVTKEERQKLVNILKEFPLSVSSARSFNEAIITQGGVSVKDVNPATMESKKVENMYFAGEVLDIDALTGGYNLQLAWSTGYLAGLSVK